MEFISVYPHTRVNVAVYFYAPIIWLDHMFIQRIQEAHSTLLLSIDPVIWLFNIVTGLKKKNQCECFKLTPWVSFSFLNVRTISPFS